MYTMSFWAGIAFMVVVTIVCIAVYLLARFGNSNEWEFRESKPLRVIAIVALCVFWLIGAGGFFPYEKAYHAYIDYSGVVEEIDSRLLPSGDAMQEKFVVRFQGSQQEYGCEDTRCALVEPGDYLVIACIKRWDYNGTDGYDCKFRRNEGARS